MKKFFIEFNEYVNFMLITIISLFGLWGGVIYLKTSRNYNILSLLITFLLPVVIWSLLALIKIIGKKLIDR